MRSYAILIIITQPKTAKNQSLIVKDERKDDTIAMNSDQLLTITERMKET